MYKISSKNSSRVMFANALAGRTKKDPVFLGLPKKVLNALKSDSFVEESIVKVVKSGFLVTFLGCRAFCPFAEFPRNRACGAAQGGSI
ncbi:MAG: hypothetical protein JZU65_23850 [Chlorobium sp.]|nr:hypothetical protein [Chlorobium sp.]